MNGVPWCCAFGGLISTFAVQAMRDVAGALGRQVSLRALQTNFIAPIGAGRLTVSSIVLREGKSVRQVQATVTQRDEVAALMVGVFGSDRETTVPALLPTRPPTAKEVDDIKPFPFVAGRRPNFTAHLDMRWGDGAPPFTGVDTWNADLHLRLLDSDAATLSPELMTVLMSDAFTHAGAEPLQDADAREFGVVVSRTATALAARAAGGWWRADNRAVAASGVM